MEIKYLNSWEKFFASESDKEYFKNLVKNLNIAYREKICYPSKENIFRLFSLIKPQDIKVVIIGQDPYHNPNQANGIAFSVFDNVKLPPSLQNIFKELEKDLNINHFHSGNLEHWVRQGVFLYNTIGSVEKNKPLSHQHFGWLTFSSQLVKYINDNFENIIFVLWGKYAQGYEQYIDINKHYIIKGAHPSPFSYHLFKDKKYFSQINDILTKNKKLPICWEL